MEELSKEKSTEQAKIIRDLQNTIILLDVEYLEEALKSMQSNLSFKEAGMILDPNPHTVMERHKLEGIKLEQLKLYLKLAKNTREIIKAESEVFKAKTNESNLKNIFGL